MSRLLPRDAALPQLDRALDPHVMAQVFAEALHGMQVRTCVVDRVKYRPQRNCTVSYVLGLHDAQRGCDFEQRVAARFCTGGGAALRQLKAAGRATLTSSAGPALLHVAQLDMLAHWFPNDAKLDALTLLHNDMQLRNHCLNKVVAELTNGRGHLIDYNAHLIQYVPEHRACMKVELHLQNRPDKPITTQTLYVKTDAEHRGAITHAVMQTLSNSPAQLSGQLRTPQSVLWQEAAGLHWQLALPGMALLDWDVRVGAGVAARVGKSLAALHATKVPAVRNAMSTLHQQPRVVADLLGQVEPAWKPLLARLIGLLEAGGKRIDHQPLVTLHGDLHPRNILVDEGMLAFIDLDSVRFGPAVLELGAWIADAIYRATLDGVAQDVTAASWRAFLAAYTKTSACIVDEPLLAWSTAHNLLCQRAYRCVCNLKPGRFEVVPQLLALADVIASAGTVNAICAHELTST